jgi:hypothetical protein
MGHLERVDWQDLTKAFTLMRHDQRAAQERRAFQREQIHRDQVPQARERSVHYIHLFQQQPEEYCSLLHVVSADVSPRLLQAFCRFFEVHLIQQSMIHSSCSRIRLSTRCKTSIRHRHNR